jgi:dipeptidyl-peptidase 4
VLVVDGRGSPPAADRCGSGRPPRPRHARARRPARRADAAPPRAAARPRPGRDPRLVLRGYLAALAVLRRPDVFRAAVAGAPVTDWHLYDTHYTERYLGHPDERPRGLPGLQPRRRRGRLPDAAARGTRPAARAAADPRAGRRQRGRRAHAAAVAALLADGRPHQVLPLSGVTHMTPQEVVAERLLTPRSPSCAPCADLDRLGAGPHLSRRPPSRRPAAGPACR